MRECAVLAAARLRTRGNIQALERNCPVRRNSRRQEEKLEAEKQRRTGMKEHAGVQRCVSTTTVADKRTGKVVGKPYRGKPDVRFDEGA